ncbi:ATP-binding protein [Arthrobacter sp. A2-55]|uniref:ATP-binding protein n=1 Tax=Arthrobacter sp. A2-55 TaxID=2897337 RepID=UPI0021CDD1EA|nr:ATP-binding protein [Arthrobacter sp. A2-55]MCU6480135.1 ATP-binding protein [Arthrobacter sp. A2-55]
MEPALNPFAPGSGVMPPAMVGRQTEIDAFDLLIARAKANTAGNRGILLTGLRGVGKTVLLNMFAEQARRNGWLVAQFEAQPGAEGPKVVRMKLARELQLGVRRLKQSSAWSHLRLQGLGSISNISVGLGLKGLTADMEFTPGRADSKDLHIDLEEMVEDVSLSMHKARAGFALVIDEMQDLDDELLGALLTVQHTAGQRGWPFYIIGGGLPSLPGKVSETRPYAERLFQYRMIGKLSHDAASDALTTPISRLGGLLGGEALELVLEAAGRYPYSLQAYGHTLWEAASGKEISTGDARLAVQLGAEALDQDFFVARWQRATGAERSYLRAMSLDGEGPTNTADLGDRLGKNHSSLTSQRGRLIEKGIIFSPEHGQIQFTVPGMGAFIARQTD